MVKVAFICVHNSCRSQMAEAISRLVAADVFEAYSAGTETKDRINPDAVETIKVCVAYEVDGERITSVPASIRRLERCKPIYEEFKGWNCPTTECTSWDELPEQAQKYVAYL